MAKYVIDETTLTGFANEVRRIEESDAKYTPEQMVSTLKTIDVSAIHEAGYLQGEYEQWSRFWDAFQQNGTRVYYDYAFYKLYDPSGFYPKHDMHPIRVTRMFLYFGNEDDPLDISARFEECGITLDTSAATDTTGVFYWTGGIKRIPEISTVNSKSLYTFCHNCYNLETIDKIILKSDGSQDLDTAFSGCPKLKNIRFEGVIGYNGVRFSDSPLLTHDSLMSIINALKDYSEDTSGTTWIVQLGSTNKAKLTAEEIEIAQNKGWTVN